MTDSFLEEHVIIKSKLSKNLKIRKMNLFYRKFFFLLYYFFLRIKKKIKLV